MSLSKKLDKRIELHFEDVFIALLLGGVGAFYLSFLFMGNDFPKSSSEFQVARVLQFPGIIGYMIFGFIGVFLFPWIFYSTLIYFLLLLLRLKSDKKK